MIIRTGKFYETKDGSRARIYAIYSPFAQAQCVHGAVWLEGAEEWEPETWSVYGKAPKNREFNNLVAPLAS